MGRRELYERGRRQHGVVTPACARAAAVPPATLRSVAQREGWPEPFPHAWVLPGHPVDGAARAAAAVLSVGGAAVLTGYTGLAEHGLLRAYPTTIELAVPRSRRPLSLRRVRAHVSRVTAAATPGRPLPVASVARCLADAEGMGRHHALTVALDALGRRSLTTDDLAAELDRRTHFAGRDSLREVLRATTADGSDSGFEFGVRRDLRLAGYEPDPDQLEVVTHRTTRRVDIPFRRRGVGLECVGFAYHGSRDQFEADAQRSNELEIAADLAVILRLTFRTYRLDWPRFLDDLRRAFATAERARSTTSRPAS